MTLTNAKQVENNLEIHVGRTQVFENMPNNVFLPIPIKQAQNMPN